MGSLNWVFDGVARSPDCPKCRKRGWVEQLSWRGTLSQAWWWMHHHHHHPPPPFYKMHQRMGLGSQYKHGWRRGKMQMAKKEAGFSTWLQRVRRTGEFSDVKVCVNGDVFRLHMLPLLNASAYFRNLPSSSNGSPSLSKDGSTRIINITDFPGTIIIIIVRIYCQAVTIFALEFRCLHSILLVAL